MDLQLPRTGKAEKIDSVTSCSGKHSGMDYHSEHMMSVEERSPAGHLRACALFGKRFFKFYNSCSIFNTGKFHIQIPTCRCIWRNMRSSCHRPNIPSWQESVGAEWPNFSHPPPFSTTLPLSQFTYLYHWTWPTWHFACSPTQACPRGANACNTDGGMSSSPQPPQICSQESLGKGKDGVVGAFEGTSEYSPGTSSTGTP